jgi:uncharacterized protein (TIGR03083 family)
MTGATPLRSTNTMPGSAGSASIDVGTLAKLGHDDAMILAEAEFARTIDLLELLSPDDWERPTVCSLWNVRSMVAHVVGMAEAQASYRQFVHDFRVARKRTGGAMIDAMNACQVHDRAALTPRQLTDGLATVAGRAVRTRRNAPALMRRMVHLRQDPPFAAERWAYGYLVDTIFTRDTWMHRLDISRATGRDMVVTAGHDDRLVADAVADWAHRHKQPFTLVLTGPAGGQWRAGDGGEVIELDAFDFCWTIAGRAPGVGLLTTPVPF